MQNTDTSNNESLFVVLVNDEGQYSIWPSHVVVPLGWRPVAPEGSKADCIASIESNWTDIAPLSVRYTSLKLFEGR